MLQKNLLTRAQTTLIPKKDSRQETGVSFKSQNACVCLCAQRRSHTSSSLHPEVRGQQLSGPSGLCRGRAPSSTGPAEAWLFTGELCYVLSSSCWIIFKAPLKKRKEKKRKMEKKPLESHAFAGVITTCKIPRSLFLKACLFLALIVEAQF